MVNSVSHKLPNCFITVLGAGAQALAGGAAGVVSAERSGLPCARHSRLQQTHCRAQLRPSDKMVAPLGKHI